MSLVEQRKFNPSTDVMDEIPRTYYPGRGFLSDQQAYPTDLNGNPAVPTLAGGYMGLFAQGLPFGEQGPAQGPNSPIRFYEDFGQYMPYGPAGGGLPPTPICSVSKSSLEAAINPSQTKFLYFVANKRGEHIFATTLKEHNHNVFKYQKNK